MTNTNHSNLTHEIKFQLNEARDLLRNAARLIASDFVFATEQYGSAVSYSYKKLLSDVNAAIENLNNPIHFYEDDNKDSSEKE